MTHIRLALTSTILTSTTLAALLGSAAQAGAQTRPAPAVELSAGHAEFVDDASIPHDVIGAAARWYVTPRIALGPELVYMVGPRQDRDLVLTGNLTFDVRRPAAPERGRIEPYLIGGAGWFRHRNRFGRETFVSNEGAVTGGAGARVWITPRVYAGGDVRFGWEPHIRFAAQLGVQLGGPD